MTETKQITFEGRSYTVPVWVEWVAREPNGSVYAYENKAEVHRKVGMFWCANGGKIAQIFPTANGDWQDSLTKV